MPDKTFKGLCHKCLNSNIPVRNYDGVVLCKFCWQKEFPNTTMSFENMPDPTYADLKRKFERSWH